MKTGQRYQTVHLTEGQFEPGSRGIVLKNLLGIQRKREMDLMEASALQLSITDFVRRFDRDHRFTAKDLRTMHQKWLENIYAWAGDYRQVNLSKGDFHFAAAAQVQRLMAGFEKNELKTFTPAKKLKTLPEITEALAVVHTEFILIHPFREGNGRLGRILATIMGLQAGLPPLNFEVIQKGRQKQAYFSAVQNGLERDYKPMQRIFEIVIEKTLEKK